MIRLDIFLRVALRLFENQHGADIIVMADEASFLGSCMILDNNVLISKSKTQHRRF